MSRRVDRPRSEASLPAFILPWEWTAEEWRETVWPWK